MKMKFYSRISAIVLLGVSFMLSGCCTAHRVAHGTARAGEHVVHGTGRAVSHVGHGVGHVGDEIAEHTR